MAGVGTSGVVDRINTSTGVAAGVVGDPGGDVAGPGVVDAFSVVPRVAAPVFVPSSATFVTTQAVTMLTAGDTYTYYTTDGSVPTQASTLWDGNYIVLSATTVLKARSYTALLPAVKPPSAVATGVYTKDAATYVTVATVDLYNGAARITIGA